MMHDFLFSHTFNYQQILKAVQLEFALLSSYGHIFSIHHCIFQSIIILDPFLPETLIDLYLFILLLSESFI